MFLHHGKGVVMANGMKLFFPGGEWRLFYQEVLKFFVYKNISRKKGVWLRSEILLLPDDKVLCTANKALPGFLKKKSMDFF